MLILGTAGSSKHVGKHCHRCENVTELVATEMRCVQYDLTWFINPVPAPYYDALALEHGYTRGTANATTLHITVCPSP